MYVTVTVSHAAGIGPSNTAVTGTQIYTDSDGVVLLPDVITPEIARQHGPLPRPIRISRQHIVRKVYAPVGLTIPGNPAAKHLAETPEGFRRCVVRAGVAMLSNVYPDWKLDHTFTPEQVAEMIDDMAVEMDVTQHAAFDLLVPWLKTVAWFPAAPGMLCDGDRVTGVVLRSDNRGIKVQWPVENTVQDYSWAEVSEHGFTFRIRTIGA